MEADIEIDQDADGAARLPRGAGQCIRRIARVDGNPQLDLAGQFRGGRSSGWIQRGIPHQHIVGYPGHDLGLTKLCHGEAFGSPFDLQRSQPRRFVGLGVGPQLHAVPPQVLHQAPRVAGCLRQIDDHRRCGDVLFLHVARLRVCLMNDQSLSALQPQRKPPRWFLILPCCRLMTAAGWKVGPGLQWFVAFDPRE